MARKLISIAVISFLTVTSVQGIAWSDNGPLHREVQSRPVKLGTSGGNINDISSGFCCSGTLGALVEGGGIQYVLSNNHVLARTNGALPGEQIIQPGLIDQYPTCARDATDTVANLSDFITIGFKKGGSVPLNEVDAAIAEIVPGAVDPNGVVLDIGELGSETAVAVVGQAVKKSGRTTGLTTGVVSAINVTVDVGYTKECGMGGTEVARFRNQILIQSAGFSGGGDSGSVIVEGAASKPRAVGLLFAGSSDGSNTLANPIGAVLNAFGVTMPGGTAPVQPVGGIKGTVTNSSNGVPIEAAVVKVDSGQSATTDAVGSYVIANVVVGDHSVTASATGFGSRSQTATVYENQDTIVDFALKARKGRGRASHGAAIANAVRVKARHEQRIFEIEGVTGTGVSVSEKGQPVIEVYLKEERAETRAQIPASLENVPVRVVVTGLFEAF